MGHLFQSWKSYRGFPLISLRSGILVEKNRSSCFPLIICSQKAKSVAGLEYSKQTFPFWSFNCKVIYMISEKCVVCFSYRRRIFILLLTKHREKKTPTLWNRFPSKISLRKDRSLWFIFPIASKWPSYICRKNSRGAAEPWRHIHLGLWVPQWFWLSIGYGAGKKKKEGVVFCYFAFCSLARGMGSGDACLGKTQRGSWKYASHSESQHTYS